MRNLLGRLVGKTKSIESDPVYLVDLRAANDSLCGVSVLYVAVTIAIASLAFPDSGYAEDKIKSELMALVGMKIPPAIPYKKQGEIPGWHSHGSIHVGSNAIPIYGENGYIGNEGGFVLIYFDNEMTRTVVDARVLPLNLLRFDLKDGKRVWRKDANKRFSVESCKKTGSEDAIIGLMSPERGKEGCLHYSWQVKMAWRVNVATSKLEEISPKGLSCFFPNGEDECYN